MREPEHSDPVIEAGHAVSQEDLSTPVDDQQREPGVSPWTPEDDDAEPGRALARVQLPDHPDLLFVQALGYTVGRPDGKPLWIVVHDMEASETVTRAESTAAYFANPSDGRKVSSHYCADVNSIVQCVLLKDSAWTVGNRPGNNRGINWEFAGFASQTRTQWLDDYGRAMLAGAVPYMRSDAARFGIPLTRRSVTELKAWQPGITSHNDLRLAFGGTTHTDPGGSFPWDYFLTLLAGDGEDTLSMLCMRGDRDANNSNPRNRPVAALQRAILKLDPTALPGSGVDGWYGGEVAGALVRLGLTAGGDPTGDTFGPEEWANLLEAIGRLGGAAPGLPKHEHKFKIPAQDGQTDGIVSG